MAVSLNRCHFTRSRVSCLMNSYTEENYSFLVILILLQKPVDIKKKMMHGSIGWRTDAFNAVSE